MENRKKSTTKLGICEKIHTIQAFYPITKETMIIDGKSIAHSILMEVLEKTKTLTTKPRIVDVLLGDNPASLSYIRQKGRSAEIAGIDFELRQFSADTTEDELLTIVE